VGGDGVKFGDAATAVALYGVLQILIAFPLAIMMLQTLGVTMLAHYGAGLTAVFLSMLIVGYLFGEEIQKGRRDAILRIVVLSAFYELLVVVFQPTLADWVPFAIDTPKEAFAGTPVTTVEWFLYNLSRRGNLFSGILIVMGLGFIGLYAGSMLRKPKAS
jgi:hypothetical protein